MLKGKKKKFYQRLCFSHDSSHFSPQNFQDVLTRLLKLLNGKASGGPATRCQRPKYGACSLRMPHKLQSHYWLLLCVQRTFYTKSNLWVNSVCYQTLTLWSEVSSCL